MTGRLPDPQPYLHGAHAPVVVVPARVAAWLNRRGLDALRAAARGVDVEVDSVLDALHLAGQQWRTSAYAEASAEVAWPQAEVAPPLTSMSTGQAADRLGITERAVRMAITAGRLPAEMVDGRWQINRDDFEHYLAARAA